MAIFVGLIVNNFVPSLTPFQNHHLLQEHLGTCWSKFFLPVLVGPKWPFLPFFIITFSTVHAYFLGMSPSQTSPSANQTDREMNAKERGDHQGLGAVGIRTPPLPNVPPLDPDHRNHRSGTLWKTFTICLGLDS